MDSLSLRSYTSDDFKLIESWWRQHYNNDFRPGYVPLASFVVLLDGVPSGFFGVCPMTPDFAYLAFPMVNPNLDKDAREKSVDFIIEAAKLWIKHAGIPLLWISIRGESFLNRLGKAGFIAAESGNTHMFYKGGDIK